jgi:NAD(P)-dependent dehydrogenase (short-subunit alcohol dehydrogenase family)
VDALAKQLRADGYEATPVVVDVSARESVAALATKAEELGDVRSVVHTAGLSPEQASADAILAVDLLGVALVLEEFAEVIAPGGAGVVIASMAGHLYPDFPAEQAQQLATTPADELLDLPFVAAIDNSAVAYGFAKQGNLVRVQAANTRWGVRGARVNSISPGVIATPMGQAEVDGENAAVVRMLGRQLQRQAGGHDRRDRRGCRVPPRREVRLGHGPAGRRRRDGRRAESAVGG